jgi:RNA polymerase sigma-70 factor (ECF subfamily)
MENLQQLIAGCKNKNRDCQKQLYEAYSRPMYSVCLRYAPDTETAEDLLHDGFIKIFSAIDSYLGKGSFEGWMRRIFINIALEKIRKEKSAVIITGELYDIQDITDDETERANQIPEEELMKMIQELPKGYRTVFNLHAIEDFSHKEIASMLGVTESTSRSQYIRARQILQVKVIDYLKKNSD